MFETIGSGNTIFLPAQDPFSWQVENVAVHKQVPPSGSRRADSISRDSLQATYRISTEGGASGS